MRLAPDPLNGGGMPPNDVEVRWEMATDENFTDVVRSGTEIAAGYQAHSVHVANQGLEPSTYYWYRFKAGDEVSPVGRTKTTPPFGAPLSSMKFAFASCADYQEGYFPAYRAIAEAVATVSGAAFSGVVAQLGRFTARNPPRPAIEATAPSVMTANSRRWETRRAFWDL
jgi:phosphodiesterase/alkaline phosphatase D-like protein